MLQADGGTRTAAITGAYVALHDAVTWLAERKSLAGKVEKVMHRSIQAVSVGIIDGEPRLDLMYLEDVAAEVDMNVVCTGDGDFVEVQGTGEDGVFRRDQMDALLDLAVAGCAELAAAQQKALHDARMSASKLLLATANQKKLVELQRILDAALGAEPGRRWSGWPTSRAIRTCPRPA